MSVLDTKNNIRLPKDRVFGYTYVRDFARLACLISAEIRHAKRGVCTHQGIMDFQLVKKVNVPICNPDILAIHILGVFIPGSIRPVCLGQPERFRLKYIFFGGNIYIFLFLNQV